MPDLKISSLPVHSSLLGFGAVIPVEDVINNVTNKVDLLTALPFFAVNEHSSTFYFPASITTPALNAPGMSIGFGAFGDGLSVGDSSNAVGALCVAVGSSAAANGSFATALGSNSVASGDESIAIGVSALATADGSVQIKERLSGAAPTNTLAFGDINVVNDTSIIATSYATNPSSVPAAGTIIRNSTSNNLQFSDGVNWNTVGGSSSSSGLTYASFNMSAPTNALATPATFMDFTGGTNCEIRGIASPAINAPIEVRIRNGSFNTPLYIFQEHTSAASSDRIELWIGENAGLNSRMLIPPGETIGFVYTGSKWIVSENYQALTFSSDTSAIANGAGLFSFWGGYDFVNFQPVIGSAYSLAFYLKEARVLSKAVWNVSTNGLGTGTYSLSIFKPSSIFNSAVGKRVFATQPLAYNAGSGNRFAPELTNTPRALAVGRYIMIYGCVGAGTAPTFSSSVQPSVEGHRGNSTAHGLIIAGYTGVPNDYSNLGGDIANSSVAFPRVGFV